MPYKISKELFEAVTTCEYISLHNNEVVCSWVDENNLYQIKTINVDSFFFKCKNYAYEQGYFISSGIVDVNNDYVAFLIHSDHGYVEEFRSKSEQQSVFDACEFLLKMKGKQNA